MTESPLQKIIILVAVKRAIEALDRKRSELSVTQIDLSLNAGLTRNAFAKNLGQMEDIRLSRFINYWCTLNRLADNPGLETFAPIPLSVQRIADLATQMGVAELTSITNDDKELFISMLPDVKSLHNKGIVAEDEYNFFSALCDQYRQEIIVMGAQDE